MSELEDHGHSVAAWTAVVILIVASGVIAGGIGFHNNPVIIVGLVLVVIGLVAGKVLSMAGFGSKRVEKVNASGGTTAIR